MWSGMNMVVWLYVVHEEVLWALMADDGVYGSGAALRLGLL